MVELTFVRLLSIHSPSFNVRVRVRACLGLYKRCRNGKPSLHRHLVALYIHIYNVCVCVGGVGVVFCAGLAGTQGGGGIVRWEQIAQAKQERGRERERDGFMEQSATSDKSRNAPMALKISRTREPGAVKERVKGSSKKCPVKTPVK